MLPIAVPSPLSMVAPVQTGGRGEGQGEVRVLVLPHSKEPLVTDGFNGIMNLKIKTKGVI
jgi:hypothetical protein